MSISQEQQALGTAIDTLYHVFDSRMVSKHVEGCSCCVAESDMIRLQSKSLRDLSADDLWRYAFKAMTTWGSVEDFKHFLPRLLELITDDPSITQELDVEILFGNLRYAEWQTWPKKEQEAVNQYLMALWRYLLTLPPEVITIESFLCGYGQAIDDLMPYLNIWGAENTETALNQLLGFVDAQGSLHKRNLSNAFWTGRREQMFQVVGWLTRLGLT